MSRPSSKVSYSHRVQIHQGFRVLSSLIPVESEHPLHQSPIYFCSLLHWIRPIRGKVGLMTDLEKLKTSYAMNTTSSNNINGPVLQFYTKFLYSLMKPNKILPSIHLGIFTQLRTVPNEATVVQLLRLFLFPENWTSR